MEGPLRRKTLLKEGRKPAVSAAGVWGGPARWALRRSPQPGTATAAASLSARPHRAVTAGQGRGIRRPFRLRHQSQVTRAGPGGRWLHDPRPRQGLSAPQRPRFHSTSVTAAPNPTREPRLWAAPAAVCPALPLLLRPPSPAHGATWRCPVLPVPTWCRCQGPSPGAASRHPPAVCGCRWLVGEGQSSPSGHTLSLDPECHKHTGRRGALCVAVVQTRPPLSRAESGPQPSETRARAVPSRRPSREG